MPRLRIIRPNFPQSPAMGRVGREARLLFILLWTAADDAGRLRLVPELLVEQLFPFDTDALMLLPSWLDELERERLIERYSIEAADYLRVVQWRRLQSIQHPKRSRLPGAPSEQVHHDRHDDHEESPESPMARASEGNIHDGLSEEEVALLSQTGELTPERILDYLHFALRKSIAHDVHTAPARYIELAGRHRGMWGGKGAPVGRKAPAESRSPSPAELHGLPETRASD